MRILALLLSLLLTAPVWAGTKALVLGNGAYAHTDPLRNAPNDARDMALRLRSLGFEVFEGIDLDRTQTLRLVQDFARALHPEDTALFFFAGHGIQLGGDNYILPVDAMPGSEIALTDSAIRLQSILQTMENSADTRIVILDACRNNPFLQGGQSRSTAAARGLMRMEAGVGSFIAFSTEPGNVAADGQGRNSPFTEALLRHIGTPGADIHAVMRAVRSDVMDSTNRTQVPWENSSLISEVFLASQPPVPAIAPVVPAPLQPRNVQPSHMVSGLDPNGDGFLSLRTGAQSGAQEIARMTEGTLLEVLGTNGAWLRVRTRDGLEGWAHSRWIAPVGSPVPATRPAQTAAPADGASQCDRLWFARNSIFANKGYCFTSARGKAAFSNANCIPGMAVGDVPLTDWERAEIARIQAQERRLGCN